MLNLKKIFFIPIILIIITAFTGYSIDSYKSSQENEVKYIQKQLEEFYLPLKSNLHNSKILWTDYKFRYGEEKNYNNINLNKKNADTDRWRINMIKKYQPLHEDSLEILKKRYLAIQSKELNDGLDTLFKHINNYKVIVTNWQDDYNSSNISSIHFPNNLEIVVDKDIYQLKNKLNLLK